MNPHTLSNLRAMFAAPACYNMYPILNEVHHTAVSDPASLGLCPCDESGYFADVLTGRVFSSALRDTPGLYGVTSKMRPYVELQGLTQIDEFRVPYRKIAVYGVGSLSDLQIATSVFSSRQGHVTLLRGQTSVYFTGSKQTRSADSFQRYYGGQVREPSFLASFLRSNFEELLIRALWHNQSRQLLNDVAVDLRDELPKSDFDEHLNDSYKLAHCGHMDLFALGMAQHYGMPSVGLDLTDEPVVAAWFALHKMVTLSGRATVSVVGEDASPTVFVFQCPEAAVFDFSSIKPKHFPTCRPDRQHAWFGHVGWGMAKNQLANYLVCAFRLDREMVSEFGGSWTDRLFPPRTEDRSLDAFLNQRENEKYKGEARRAIDYVYEVER